MRRRHFGARCATALVVMTALAMSWPAQSASGQALRIVLDAGHTPNAPGATGIRGVQEVVYNDQFVAELKSALETAGHEVILTRLPQDEITLDQRADIANQRQADLFLSIHHDSAQVIYLEKIEAEGRAAWKTRTPIRGYSVFVSTLNPAYEASLMAAKSVASELLKLGRLPTLHHAEKIPGESRELLDATLGVYRFDQLVVLRKTRVPAVLLEIGVIVDEHDEAHVRDPAKRTAMVAAVVRGLGLWGAGFSGSKR